MSAKIQNNYGLITIENEVIARLAGLVAMDCYGIVGMAAKNVKDGLVQLLKRESLTKGIKINFNDGLLIIDMHIIVEYGTNIQAIAESILSTVKYKVTEYSGIEVSHVTIHVEGVRVNS